MSRLGSTVEAMDPVTALEGRLVRLEPLAEGHVPGLVAAAAEDRGRFGYTAVPADVDTMTSYVAELVAGGRCGDVVPFAQRRLADGREVGVTRFMTIRRGEDGRPWAVEIGGTWLGASAQATGINVEAKFLLLRHAFESWPVVRVDFKTDARNERSRRALAALGAVYEGTLRAWQPSFVAGEEGQMRDSAFFSILRSEWPEVRDRLALRLAAREPRA